MERRARIICLEPPGTIVLLAFKETTKYTAAAEMTGSTPMMETITLTAAGDGIVFTGTTATIRSSAEEQRPD
ncbi:hypothetical protein AEJ54_09065 [Azospirillum sp. Sp 7]|nr:hypothetical protein AMK58_08480 [Azospirillum brasilense]OPH16639.1 hypothetical protein FE89_03780 [Azospirillum brasilense]PWC94686.1 hypothetical protein AEJ54_09065 [Azospirillum sp. Sp 7]